MKRNKFGDIFVSTASVLIALLEMFEEEKKFLIAHENTKSSSA